MTNPRVNRLLASLETEFEAEQARGDEEAAADLALTLLCDSSLQLLLRSRGWYACASSGRKLLVEEVGRDAVIAEGRLMRVSTSRFIAAQGRAPRRSERTLSGVLGAWTGGRCPVELVLREGTMQGLLTRAGRDHLVLESGRDEWLLPLEHVLEAGLLHRGPGRHRG